MGVLASDFSKNSAASGSPLPFLESSGRIPSRDYGFFFIWLQRHMVHAPAYLTVPLASTLFQFNVNSPCLALLIMRRGLT